MMQDSLPSMMGPCEPKTSLKKVLRIIFICTFVGIIFISYLGIAAFGGKMVVNNYFLEIFYFLFILFYYLYILESL
jgi:hypothetical protein